MVVKTMLKVIQSCNGSRLCALFAFTRAGRLPQQMHPGERWSLRENGFSSHKHTAMRLFEAPVLSGFSSPEAAAWEALPDAAQNALTQILRLLRFLPAYPGLQGVDGLRSARSTSRRRSASRRSGTNASRLRTSSSGRCKYRLRSSLPPLRSTVSARRPDHSRLCRTPAHSPASAAVRAERVFLAAGDDALCIRSTHGLLMRMLV